MDKLCCTLSGSRSLSQRELRNGRAVIPRFSPARCATRTRLGLSLSYPLPLPAPTPATATSRHPSPLPNAQSFLRRPAGARRVGRGRRAAAAVGRPRGAAGRRHGRTVPPAAKGCPRGVRSFLFLFLRGAVWWGGGEGWGWGWGWGRGWHGGAAVVCCTRGRGTCPMGFWLFGLWRRAVGRSGGRGAVVCLLGPPADGGLSNAMSWVVCAGAGSGL